MFDGKKYLTKGVQAEIPLELQMFMWKCIATMPNPKDYLQVFHLSVTRDGKQNVVHTQEQPDYKAEYTVNEKNPVTQKVFVIDDGNYCTMLLAEEY